jgi:hypothetical protein
VLLVPVVMQEVKAISGGNAKFAVLVVDREFFADAHCKGHEESSKIEKPAPGEICAGGTGTITRTS